jgi:hypothetical protein
MTMLAEILIFAVALLFFWGWKIQPQIDTLREQRDAFRPRYSTCRQCGSPINAQSPPVSLALHPDCYQAWRERMDEAQDQRFEALKDVAEKMEAELKLRPATPC